MLELIRSAEDTRRSAVLGSVALASAFSGPEELLDRPVDGEPWILLEDAGAGAIAVGPRFGRGARICFRCYWGRRLSHCATGCQPGRVGSALRGRLNECLARLSGTSEHRHAEQFLIQADGEIVRHYALPLPDCGRCHALPRPRQALKLADLVSERVGIVAGISDLAPGGAYLPSVLAKGCFTDAFSSARAAAIGMAADTTREQACVRATAECVERYCASFGSTDLVRSLATELPGEALLDSEIEQYERAQPDEPLSWLQTTRLGTGEPVWVPAGRVLLPFEADAVPRVQTSCGLAAGQSQEDALRRAILEVEERDGFVRAWYGAEPPGVCAADRLLPELHLSRVPTPWGPPTVVALLELPEAPFCSGGLACRLDEAAAARSAQLEAVAGHALMLEWLAHGRRVPEGPVTRVTDYAFAHASRAELRSARQSWLEPQRPIPAAAERPIGSYLVRDLTTPDVALAGISVLRALHPERVGFEASGGGHAWARHALPHPFG
jgi:ribosomal protein S12 methylthiotransferase accessory factor YcaO